MIYTHMSITVTLIIILVVGALILLVGSRKSFYGGGGDIAPTHAHAHAHAHPISCQRQALTREILHISGPSGAGKTTLGRKIAEKFPGVVVKDIDDLRSEFIHSHYGNKSWRIIDKVAYQRYIDRFIAAQTAPIVFVGLNNIPWWHRDHYYDMHAGHKFYIDIEDAEVVRRKCTRLLGSIPHDPDAMRDLTENNARFVKLVCDAVKRDCSAPKTLKMNHKWAADYKKQHYKFAPAAEILAEVVKILS